MGTDQLGRDLSLRILHGLRTSFVVALFAALLGATLGTVVGLVAGYVGGLTDSVLMRLTDIQLSFPTLLIAMTIIAVLGQGMLLLIIVLGLSSWMLYARIIRGAVLSLRSTELVTASVGLGSTAFRILARHILPNVLAPLTAVMTLEFARIMLAEAGLSFLGFGVAAPRVSLGAILASGRDYLQNQWWIATFAGIFLALAVLSVNLVGAWLQQESDPTRMVITD